MQTLYKLTDSNGRTQNGTVWEVGVTNSLPEINNPKLCKHGVFHAYTNLNLGLLLNPIHANISRPLVFECEGTAVVEDWGKVGCFELTPVCQLDYPEWYVDESIRKDVQIQFSILCANAVLSVFEDDFPDDNRPRKAVEAAQEYLHTKTHAAADAAADAAARVAYAAYAAHAAYAADAAYAAAYAADAAYAAAYAADAAYAAAYAAARAAHAAARAAHAAAAADALDFGYLADLAVSTVCHERRSA